MSSENPMYAGRSDLIATHTSDFRIIAHTRGQDYETVDFTMVDFDSGTDQNGREVRDGGFVKRQESQSW
ncbi:hypothetical protein [Bifidobacterium sp. ESL0745]|uniref:hypothetical protein n=1 Tax=Bifidobacterium sp. ESL0745 TaxID=2983226 RepID=UPI0023F8E3C2|nr:hypothetical protein [Bifidobacterium sp. ESL0745]MDF7666106.1 hypothetical protein [Bifidobacterium sp. ESL0745]